MTRRGNIVSYDDALRARGARQRYIPSSADAMGHIVDLSDRLNSGFVSPFRTGGSSAPASARNPYDPALRLAQPSGRSARSSSSAPRSSFGSSGASRASASAIPSWYDEGFDAALYAPKAASSRGAAAPRVAAPSRGAAAPSPRVILSGARSAQSKDLPRRPSWYAGDDDIFWDEAEARAYENADGAAAGHSAVYTPEDYEEDVRREGETSGRSKREQRKRARNKEKADRKFDRQFGGDDGASDSAGGSRAAVYKGEMGAKQRRATRMQRTGANASARTLAPSEGSRESLGRRFGIGLAKVAVGVAAVFALGVFLYEPAQQYYQALREHDRLEMEYKAVEERRVRLQTDLADLQTDSGLEARAHQQLGWVKKGEQTANVRGLDVETSDGNLLQANIESADIELPQTWYSPILDPLFGVE